jgi:hypothetical protein
MATKDLKGSSASIVKSDSEESDDGAIILERLDAMRSSVDENSRRMRGYEESLDRLVRTVEKMAAVRIDSMPRPSSRDFPSRITPRKGDTEPPVDDRLGDGGDLDAAVLQGAFVQVRDSVAKVVLPARMSMGDTGPNVRGDSRKMLNFIRKCGTYTTTVLKVMKSAGEKAEPEESDWDTVYTCVASLHRQLQAEQTACVFEGSGVPSDTLQLYRFLSRNSTIGKHETQALENASRLSAAIHMSKTNVKQDGQNQRGGFRGRRFGDNYRGRGQSNFRGYNRGSSNRDSGDYFENVVTSTASGKP